MKSKVMLGLWRYILSVPPFLLEKERARARERVLSNLAFMTPEHRRVHHHVVRQLPFSGKPLAPADIAEVLQMKRARLAEILDDLEKHMTFLFRNPEGDVIWAYPVTVEKTPHAVVFSTGEQIYAA